MIHHSRTVRRLISLSLFMGCIANCWLLGKPPANDGQTTKLANEVHNKGWIVYTGPSEKDDWDLFIMRPDGSDKRNLTQTPDYHEIGARFSPNGKQLLFRRIPRNTKLGLDKAGAHGELVLAKSDGSELQVQGKPAEFPWATWGPDGREIACLTKGGIEIFDLASKKLLRTMDGKGIYH